MLTSVDDNSACLTGSLEDKGLFRSAYVDILQIAEAVHRVVFLLFVLRF